MHACMHACIDTYIHIFTKKKKIQKKKNTDVHTHSFNIHTLIYQQTYTNSHIHDHLITLKV